jgi:anthranilate synthase component 2
MTATLLVIDNYDSFTYNLVQMFRCYPLEIAVFRSDAVSLEEIRRRSPDYLLVSPGPRDPRHAGISMALIDAFYRQVPLLGVCLGMQCINEVFGGRTRRAHRPLHGKTSAVHHDESGLFRGIPSPFRAARYHSLVIDPSPSALQGDLIITARTRNQTVMGISHRRYPLHGVQFHPESFMTEHGFRLVENFLAEGPMGNAHDARITG